MVLLVSYVGVLGLLCYTLLYCFVALIGGLVDVDYCDMMLFMLLGFDWFWT